MRMNQEMEDDEKGKLFVGGLSWETTHDNLQRYFCRFGDVIDCVVMKNNESGRSRGFGFVTFSDPIVVDNVLRNGPHSLDGRTIDPKPCNPRTLQKPKKGGGYPKVFLGGLPSNITETDLRLFFGRYGKVMEVVIMYDQEKKKSRGFGFLSFEDETSVDRITNEHFINLNGKQVEIKKAEPRDGSHPGHKVNNSVITGGSTGTSAGPVGDNSQWGPNPSVGINHSQLGGGGQGNQTGCVGNNPLPMMQAPNGQMSGPSLSMQQAAAAAAAMTAPTIMQNYQGWGNPTPPQQPNYGYGTPNAQGSYQGWGGPPPQAPPAPPPPPHQWNNYAAAQQNQGYQGYASSILSTKNIWPNNASCNANWNSWNMPQNSAGDLYSRQQPASNCPSGPLQSGGGTANMQLASGVLNSVGKNAADYIGYGNTSGFGTYSNEQQNSYVPRSNYGNDVPQQQFQVQASQARSFSPMF